MSKLVLVACECSQVVTQVMRTYGAQAYSCDIRDCYGGHPEWHIKEDVLKVLEGGWDMIIAHPPCTYLSKVSAVAKSKGQQTPQQMYDARAFFLEFTKLNVPTAIENPIPLRAAQLPPATQYICPSDFGHQYTRKTGLWLYGLPPLLPTHGHYIGCPSYVTKYNHTGGQRSRFHEGIAIAMAQQWLPLI